MLGEKDKLWVGGRSVAEEEGHIPVLEKELAH